MLKVKQLTRWQHRPTHQQALGPLEHLATFRRRPLTSAPALVQGLLRAYSQPQRPSSPTSEWIDTNTETPGSCSPTSEWADTNSETPGSCSQKHQDPALAISRQALAPGHQGSRLHPPVRRYKP